MSSPKEKSDFHNNNAGFGFTLAAYIKSIINNKNLPDGKVFVI